MNGNGSQTKRKDTMLKEVEEKALDWFLEKDSGEVPLVFIIGSPRTGSTLLYQILINFFGFYYFKNFVVERFATVPALGVLIDLTMEPITSTPIKYISDYDKMEGAFRPSEALPIFRYWFGCEKPSQTRSCDFLSAERKSHMIATVRFIWEMSGKVLLTKNVWNCFRIKALAEAFPKACFVWVRRDIGFSALSDLKARERWGRLQDSASKERAKTFVWNSATTTNYKEIQQLPCWEQVVEQQYEYNKAVYSDLSDYALGRYVEIWYEDVCDNLETQLVVLDDFFRMNKLAQVFREKWKKGEVPHFEDKARMRRPNNDFNKIFSYLGENYARFYPYMREW